MTCKTNICKCGETYGVFFGKDECATQIGYTRRLAFMPLLDKSGVRNYINLSDGGLPPALETLDATFFDNLMRIVPNDKKLYLTPLVENVEFAPQESDFEEFDSGRSIKIKDNGTEITALLVSDDADFYALRQARNLLCGQWGFFEIDNLGNLIGDVHESIDFKLYPIPLSKMNVQFVRKSAKESQKITVSFQIADYYNESTTGFVPCSLLDIDLVTLQPVQQLVVAKDTTAATTTDIYVYVHNGDAYNLTQTPVVGLLVANFKCFESDGTPQNPASVTELPDGHYKLTGTFAAADAAKVELNYAGHWAEPLTVNIP